MTWPVLPGAAESSLQTGPQGGTMGTGMTRRDQPEREGGSSASDQAIGWLVRLRSGRAGAEERARFEAWRRAHPENDAAAREAEALWTDLGAVRRPPDIAAPASRALRRRTLLGMAAAAGAVLLAVGLEKQVNWPGLFADYATGLGERRVVGLPDGSKLTLDAGSAASVAFAEGVRRILLHGGRAHFDVARDPSRPFVVVAGRGEARVLGTVFQVARAGDGARVVVVKGEVELAAGSGRTRLAAGDGAGYDGDGRLSESRAVAAAETAWLRGRAMFDRRPLREVIAAVAPYHAGRVVILTDRAAALEVTGVFDLADVDALLRAVERSLPVTVTRLPLLTAIR
ncbi:MAG: DUF4880 domain-containing protein [Alphaproteobacteria bacterium]|nr:DUF4880 domain-containing protein [Alphaproteobacteria bacterium]